MISIILTVISPDKPDGAWVGVYICTPGSTESIYDLSVFTIIYPTYTILRMFPNIGRDQLLHDIVQIFLVIICFVLQLLQSV